MLRIPNPTKAFLAALLFSSSAIATASRADCLRNRADEAACGDKTSLNHWFSQLPSESELFDHAALIQGYVKAGCTPAEAEIEAAWTVKQCIEKGFEAGEAELRRRQAGRPSDDDDDAPKTTAKPTGKDKETTANKNTAPQTDKNAPKKDAKTTDAPAPTVAAPTTAPTTAPPPPPTTATAERQPTILAVTSTSTKRPCYTTTTIQTTHCPTQSTGADAGKKLECVPTQMTQLQCNQGMLCSSDSQGQAVCLEVDNRFTTAGVIISLFFAVGVALSVAGICFLCCRERRKENRLLKAAEAAAIAKAAALDKKRPSVAVRSVSAQSDQAPLMGGPQPGGVMYANDGGADPFADPSRR